MKITKTLLPLVLTMTTLTSVRAADSQPPTPPHVPSILATCRSHLAAAKQILDGLLKTSGTHSEANTLHPYNELSRHLDAAGSLAGLISHVHPDKAVRGAAETCEQEVSRFSTDLSLNRELYETFTKVDTSGLADDSVRLVSKTIQDFKRSGVDKDEKTRDLIKQLNEELVLIGQEFSRNITEDTRFIELDSVSELEGMPQDYIDAHKPDEKGKIRITTDYPDYIPFMSYAKSGAARKRLAEVFKNRSYPTNEPVFKKMLEKRHELAQVLGYANWADYITEDKMIRSGSAVAKFIDEVADISKARAERDYAKLLEFKKRDDATATRVEDWEKTYYEEKVKVEEYSMDSKETRAYFEFGAVKKGLLDLTAELFGIRYTKVTNADIWHQDVDVYDVVDAGTDKALGRIYLDLHPRDGKYKHAAQFTVKSGVAGVQLPEGALVCNFPDPKTSSGPALMEHGDVVTFFHEFGHLIHHVLGGHQRWIRFSGVATEWDFVEAPSQFLEEWAWEHKVLSRFAKHADSGEVIPEVLVQRMREAEEFGQGTAARTQMFYAALSLNYHNQDPKNIVPVELVKELQAKYSLFPYQEGTNFHLNFGHLQGYSAMYYTYMWSQVIARDLLSPFKDKGLMDLDVARAYRQAVLEAGGSKDAAELVKDFLGRPYSFDAFKTWLNGQCNKENEKILKGPQRAP